jgi:hypothetical protein
VNAGWRPPWPVAVVMATGAKPSTTEQQDGFEDDERMAKAMPAAAIRGAMVAFVVRLVVCDGGKARPGR